MGKQQRGFTLIELIVVFAVVLLLTSVLMRSVSLHSDSETARRLNKDAALLLESMKQYYVYHCSDSVFPAVSVSTLRDEGFLGGAIQSNPWGSPHTVAISNASSMNPIFTVTLSFNSDTKAQYVASISSNARVTGSSVTWVKHSPLSRSQSGVRKQLDREAFGMSLC